MMSAPGLRAKVPAGLLLLLPHLLEATAHAHQLGAVPGHAATILSTAGAGLRDTGQLDTSRPVLDRALAIAQEHLGPDTSRLSPPAATWPPGWTRPGSPPRPPTVPRPARRLPVGAAAVPRGRQTRPTSDRLSAQVRLDLGSSGEALAPLGWPPPGRVARPSAPGSALRIAPRTVPLEGMAFCRSSPRSCSLPVAYPDSTACLCAALAIYDHCAKKCP